MKRLLLVLFIGLVVSYSVKSDPIKVDNYINSTGGLSDEMKTALAFIGGKLPEGFESRAGRGDVKAYTDKGNTFSSTYYSAMYIDVFFDAKEVVASILYVKPERYTRVWNYWESCREVLEFNEWEGSPYNISGAGAYIKNDIVAIVSSYLADTSSVLFITADEFKKSRIIKDNKISAEFTSNLR